MMEFLNLAHLASGKPLIGVQKSTACDMFASIPEIVGQIRQLRMPDGAFNDDFWLGPAMRLGRPTTSEAVALFPS